MDPRVNKVIIFLSAHFRQDLKLEDLAEIACLSKFHFQRLFKQETGQSPLQYLHRVRLDHAAHFLIMYPGCKQTDVAFECGYSSPSVFSRSFRKHFHMAPSDYQAKYARQSDVTSSRPASALPVTYLSRRTIRVYSSNLLSDNISALYERIIREAAGPLTCFGVFIDVPMHKAPEEARYFAGPEAEQHAEKWAWDTFDIEDGYYTWLELSGDTSTVFQQLVRFKQEQIDPSPYVIASLIGFEKIRLPAASGDFDYFSSPRTLYIKIRRE